MPKANKPGWADYTGPRYHMPVLDPAKPKYRTTSGSDERGITIQPSTEDRIPEVPVIKKKRKQI